MKYTERELLKYKYQKKLFDKLEDTEQYICVKDLQGGTFCVGFVGTTKGFVARMLEWVYMDGYIDEDKKFINYILENKNEDAIGEIAEHWDIEIIRVVDYLEEENSTEDEIAWKRYLLGWMCYEDYVDICNIEEVEPLNDIRNIILEDNENPSGGISFYGETLGDFLDSYDNLIPFNSFKLNEDLEYCGIKKLTEEQIGGEF